MRNIRIEKKSDMNAVFDIQTYNINVRGNVPLPLVFYNTAGVLQEAGLAYPTGAPEVAPFF